MEINGKFDYDNSVIFAVSLKDYKKLVKQIKRLQNQREYARKKLEQLRELDKINGKAISPRRKNYNVDDFNLKFMYCFEKGQKKETLPEYIKKYIIICIIYFFSSYSLLTFVIISLLLHPQFSANHF